MNKCSYCEKESVIKLWNGPDTRHPEPMFSYYCRKHLRKHHIITGVIALIVILIIGILI